MRPGVRIGVDVGAVRVGVAASDRDATVVLAVATLTRDPVHARDLDDLAAIVSERDAVEVVVGLPLGLSGRPGAAAAAATAYARAVAARVAPVPVRLVDERFSTAEAVRALQPGRGRPGSATGGQVGRSARSGRVGSRGGRAGRGDRVGRSGLDAGGGGRTHLDSRALRSVVDAEAAAIIVRSALAEEAATGLPPGRAPAD